MEQNGDRPIQWYPGHMAKAKRMLQDNLRVIDVVVELVDARAPESSRNPDFDGLFRSKARVILLNKSDLADPQETKRWMQYYRARGFLAGEVVSTANNAKKTAVSLITRAAAPRVEAMKEKGIQKVVRCMVVGIPNVGKSTLINRVAGMNRAEVGDRPGVTKAKQWVKITPYLELMDTPGLLWPKLENQDRARHLAFLGSIRDEIMDTEALARELLVRLNAVCPEALRARYKKITAESAADGLLNDVAFSRGFLFRGGEPDTERAAHIVLDEFRGGKIARVTLDRAPVVEKPQADGAEDEP